MASLAGVAYRLRIILSAVTAPSSRLPIPIENSTYYDAVMRVGRGDSEVPVANAAIISLLLPFVPELELDEGTDVLPFSSLCRDGTHNRDSCEPDVGKLLYQIARLIKPRTVIEVGTFVGAASCHLALALQRNANQAELHLVDISPAYLEEARKNLSNFGLSDQVFFHCGDSAEIARAGNLPNADLVFLDGGHTREAVRRDIESYWPIIRDDGLLLLHDSILWNGVRYHVNKLARILPDSVYTIATSSGSGISIVRKSRDLPPLKQFYGD